ncbi:hypothetical protein FRB93_006615 [Tulasnella sp. JGI-2019a]|nr:hypothetical protein FRB93_006615 [Tulasnella sp. JGI-2019a]
MVSIVARCQKGGVTKVYIRRSPAPHSSRPPKKKSEVPTTAGVTSSRFAPRVSTPKAIWVVVQTVYEREGEKKGRSQIVSKDGWDTVYGANEAAWDLMMEVCALEEDDEEGIKALVADKNRGSDMKEYSGRVDVRDGTKDPIRIQVQKITIHCAPQAANAGASAGATRNGRALQGRGGAPPAKKQKRYSTSEVIDISSDSD